VLEAAFNPDQWPEALRGLAAACGADHAFALLDAPRKMDFLASRGSFHLLDDFEAGGWSGMNKRIPRAFQILQEGTKGMLTEWRCFAPHELARDPFEQGFAARHGNTHFAGNFIPAGVESHMAFTVERSSAKGAFRGSDLDEVDALFRMLTISLRYAFKAEVDITRSIFDALDKAHARVTGTARLIHSSPAFESYIGNAVHIRDGRVRAANPEADGELQWLIAETASGRRSNRAVALVPEHAGEVTAYALPIRGAARDHKDSADVLLSIVAPRPAPATSHDTLRSRYRLTPAEAKLAVRLSRGEVLRSAAEAEGITIETARTRLKVIFQKTSTSRQVELALLLQRMT
jgi:DNA-binding CsgD family transcriptional regulator